MSQHTPTPWECVPSTEHHGPYITSEYGNTICDLYAMSHPSEPSTAAGGRSKPVHFMHEMADANAAFIVRACNSHDALVKALERFVTFHSGHVLPEPLQEAMREARTALAAAQDHTLRALLSQEEAV